MNDSKRAIIDKGTLVPIGLVISIACAVWFISALNSKVEANDTRLVKVENAIASINDIKIQVASINVKVDSIQTQIKLIR